MNRQFILRYKPNVGEGFVCFVYYFIPMFRTVIGLHQAPNKHMQNKGIKTSRRKTNAYLHITKSSTLFVIKNKQFKTWRQYFWPIRLGDTEKTDGGFRIFTFIKSAVFSGWLRRIKIKCEHIINRPPFFLNLEKIWSIEKSTTFRI